MYIYPLKAAHCDALIIKFFAKTSFRTLLPQDEDGNAKVGKDIRLYDCKNCVVHAVDESKVVVQGLDGFIVAEKQGQLLVCELKEEQRIKEFGKEI